MRLCVIGGGMCGFAAAITAARAGANVTVLEAGARPLRKLRASGGGRGNLMNLGAPRYYGDVAFALSVLGADGAQQAADFWRGCGVALAREGVLVYPASFQAGDAADALEKCARENGVRVETDTRALSLTYRDGPWHIEAEKTLYRVEKTPKREKRAACGTEKLTYAADAALVCCGGAAAPQLGGTMDGPRLLQALGCALAPSLPALRPLPLAAFAGQKVCAGKRLRCQLSVVPGGDASPRFSVAGEVLFTAEGLSGIAAMQCARHVQPGDRLLLTPLGGLDEPATSVADELPERASLFPGRTLGELGVGLMDAALWRAFLLMNNCEPDRPVSHSDIRWLAERLSRWELPLAPFGADALGLAQVTAGGALCAAFSPDTLGCRALPGLYAGGETLNVDGDCGGFNLMFATLCGLRAGRAIAGKERA